jgi:PAS domain S-box-containing protein
MKTKMQPIRTMQLGFGATLAVLFAVGTVAYLSVIASNESTRWTQHTHEVLEHIAGLRSAQESVDGGYRDFALTGDEAFLQSTRTNITRLHQELSTLSALTTDNPAQQHRLGILAGLVPQTILRGDTVVRSPPTDDRKPAADVILKAQGDSLLETFSAVTGGMEDEERRLLVERSTDEERRFGQAKTVVMLASATGLWMALLAGWMVQRSLRARERADLAFREGEERNRLLIEAVQDYAICMLDPQGVVVSWNAGAERIKGYKTDEIMGQHFARFYPQEDVDKGKPEEELRIAAANGRSETEHWRVRKDGSRYWANVVITATRTSSGSLLGFSKITRDISERKETEAKYRGLLEAAPDAIVVVDQFGKIVLLNLQAEKHFGYRGDELVGKQIKNIIPEGFAERLIADGTRSTVEALAQHIGTGIELRGRRKDGSDFPIEIMLSPLQSQEGILVTAAIRDISARKRAEEHLVKTVGELKRSNDELSQFAYVASHDLQEPLRMVASYTQLLAKRYRGRLDADADEFIAYAVDGSNRMQQLIRDLLAYSRAGTGRMEFREISSELALQKALVNLHAAIQESGAVVTHDSLPGVTTDDTQLAQVFQNLIGNAIKYRSGEVPRIHVSATTDKGKERIFSVRDNGLGIDPRYFDRIFVLFQRLHGRAEFAGTGIGLAICKKILERLGGRIWVESQLRTGSIFHFALPDGVAK